MTKLPNCDYPSSIGYILTETDANSEIEPLFEIQLLLEVPKIVYSPSADIEHPEGFYALYEDIMLDIMRMATLISRVDPERATEREIYTVGGFQIEHSSA